jgi:hypothetical protein
MNANEILLLFLEQNFRLFSIARLALMYIQSSYISAENAGQRKAPLLCVFYIFQVHNITLTAKKVTPFIRTRDFGPITISKKTNPFVL